MTGEVKSAQRFPQHFARFLAFLDFFVNLVGWLWLRPSFQVFFQSFASTVVVARALEDPGVRASEIGQQ